MKDKSLEKRAVNAYLAAEDADKLISDLVAHIESLESTIDKMEAKILRLTKKLKP